MTVLERVALFVDVPGHQPLPHAPALHIAAVGLKPVVVSGIDQANAVLKSGQNILTVTSNAPDLDLFLAVRAQYPHAKIILCTALTMADYCAALQNRDAEILDHIVAHTTEEWCIQDLRITMQKLVRNDIFGLEQYLGSETSVVERKVTSSRDRDTYNAEVQKWAESCGLGKNIARLTYGITEELLMNAIYDAPVAGGRTHYEDLPRTEHRELLPDEYATLRFATNGSMLALSILDPFGAFQRRKWWEYLRKVLKRADGEGLIDTKKGGAGLGLFKILYSSHAVVCNVEPGKRTEVIVVIDLAQQVRDFAFTPRSIHYFNTTSH